MDVWSISQWPIQILLPTFLLILTCCYGDLKLQSTPHNQHLKKALYDSATHGTVGALSWIIARGPSITYRSFAEALACGLLASAIDIDHFLAARSLKVQDAVNLQKRPVLHNTSLVLVLCFSVWLAVQCIEVYFEVHSLSFVPWLLLVAWITHHTRDAHRRGFWFSPFGTTRPLAQKWLYISIILATACLTWCILNLRLFNRVQKGVRIWKTGSSPQEHISDQHEVHIEL